MGSQSFCGGKAEMVRISVLRWLMVAEEMPFHFDSIQLSGAIRSDAIHARNLWQTHHPVHRAGSPKQRNPSGNLMDLEEEKWKADRSDRNPDGKKSSSEKAGTLSFGQ
jgi:hypothetical protein